jgi:Flp pilus assembly protein TadD
MASPLATAPLLLLLLAGQGGAAGHLDRGQKLLQAGDVAGALAAFDQALKADAKDPRGHYLRGLALERKGDAAGAEAAYRLAAKHGPTMSEPRNNLGALLLAKGDVRGAEEQVTAAVKVDPRNAEARFNLGLVRDRQGQHAAGQRKTKYSSPEVGGQILCGHRKGGVDLGEHLGE